MIAAALAPLGEQAWAQDSVSEDARLHAFLDQCFDAQAALRPQLLTQLGARSAYDRLDDYTEAGRQRRIELINGQHAAFRRDFTRERLSPSYQTIFDLFDYDVAVERRTYRWRWHSFPINSTRSATGAIPAFLIGAHRITSIADAEAYVARIIDTRRALNEICADSEERARLGVTPPHFVFAPVLAELQTILSGAPFDGGPDNPIWADFNTKIAALEINENERERVRTAARQALMGPWREGYEAARRSISALAETSHSDDGVWRLPEGEDYYAECLRLQTTTNLSAEHVHDTGLGEVARIRDEMEAVKRRIGFNGSLDALIAEMKSSPAYQYPNNAEGREAYLEDARRIIAGAMEAAPRFFNQMPRAPLEVRAVETFREATSPVAFYNRGSPDGARPGIFYVNLSDMTQVLRPQIEAIAYHEGAPGHHFQISLAQERTDLPKFRRYNQYGAYTEGWGLYAERLGKDMGFYSDPISDFGRLSLELWRAARLVVDTGLHDRRWSRERAAAYLRENTLLSERDVGLEVDRYLVAPGQATSYMIGQIHILGLRAAAESRLRRNFDLRVFHDQILDEGAMPLELLTMKLAPYLAGPRP